MIDIKAHITGTLWKITAQVGDELDEEDVVMILESMKMEMPVEAPVDGTLTEILVHTYKVSRTELGERTIIRGVLYFLQHPTEHHQQQKDFV